MCDMTHSYVWHDLFICVTWLIHVSHNRDSGYLCVVNRVYVTCCKQGVCDVEYTKESRHTCEWVKSHAWHTLAMSWLRLVGSLKIWVSFAKEPYERDLYSAKETYVFKESTNRSHPILSRVRVVICVTWLIHTCDVCLYMCDVPHSYVWCICLSYIHTTTYYTTYTLHTWMRHVKHIYLRRDSFIFVCICVTCLIHMCGVYVFHTYILQHVTRHAHYTHEWGTSHICIRGMTHLYVWMYVWRASFICVVYMSFIHTYCNMLHDIYTTHMNEAHHTYIFETWLVHMCLYMCDMPHSYVWRASFICVTCLIHMCGVYIFHTYILQHVTRHIHYAYEWGTSHIYIWDMTHSYVFIYVWHASFICVTCLIHMCDVPDSYVWCIYLSYIHTATCYTT